MPGVLYIDKETRSVSDIKVAGAHLYAEHPSTDLICMGVAFDDEPVQVYAPEDVPTRVLDFVAAGGRVVAHNFPFEHAIWSNVGVKKYGWPILRPEQGDCTMARSYAMSIPGGLDGARAAMGIIEEKDAAGHRLMLKMSQPKSVRKGKETLCPCGRIGNTGCTSCFGLGRVVEWHNEPEQMERLFAYCRQDVEVERKLDRRLLPLSLSERKIWLLDFQINSLGVKIDRAAAEKAVDLVNTEEMRLHREMRAITQQQVATCKAHLQLKQWIIGQGVPAQGVAKNDVTELLARADLPDRVRAALEIRREAAKSSTAKLKAMLSRAGANQRIRGLFQFCGANTGRWSGRSVQLQNLKKPSIPQEEIEEVFKILGAIE